MHASLKLAETVLWAPSLPPRSGGEGGAAPAGGAPGGGWCNCAQTPPTPDPSPPLASARGGRGAERPVVSLSRCVHALVASAGTNGDWFNGGANPISSRSRSSPDLRGGVVDPEGNIRRAVVRQEIMLACEQRERRRPPHLDVADIAWRHQRLGVVRVESPFEPKRAGRDVLHGLMPLDQIVVAVLMPIEAHHVQGIEPSRLRRRAIGLDVLDVDCKQAPLLNYRARDLVFDPAAAPGVGAGEDADGGGVPHRLAHEREQAGF